MAAGAPLVTTLGTGAAETVTNGVNGFRVPFPVHPEALAQAMDQALALDRSRLIGHNDQVLQAFDWDKNVADTLAAYETALGRPL
jgi:glycosyltransferase involved in cell wall biosynthesis